jgi:hypothetical protein
MNVRDALEQRFQKKMMRMREALERFNNESAEREMVGPNWNVRDLVGHYVYWTNEGAEQVKRLNRDESLPNFDLEKINADVYRKNRNMPFLMLLPQLRMAEERLLNAIRHVEPSKLVSDSPVRDWIDIQIEHHDHHWPGLEAAGKRIAR